MTTDQKAGESLLVRDVERREWVEFVKGAAIILIVAYHSILFLNSIGVEPGGIGRTKIVLELFPMPAFFLISGMFHFRVPQWTLADTWRRRLRQYLYLYLLWSLIRFVFYLVAPNVRSDGAGATASDPLALLGVLIWPISSYWFIYALVIFTLVLWVSKWIPLWGLIAAAAVLSATSSSGLLEVHNVGWNRMSEYLVYFLLGAALHRRVYDWAESLTWWKLACWIVAFGAVVGAAMFVGGLLAVPGVALVAQCLAVAVGYGLAVYLVRLRPLGWVVYLGRRTLNIYLVHIFLIALVVAGLTLVPQIQRVPGLLVLVVVTAAVTYLSVLLTRYLTRVSWLFVYPFAKRTRTLAAPARKAAE